MANTFTTNSESFEVDGAAPEPGDVVEFTGTGTVQSSGGGKITFSLDSINGSDVSEAQEASEEEVIDDMYRSAAEADSLSSQTP